MADTDPIVPVLITLPQSYLDAIDEERGEEKRSEWIRETLRRGKLRAYKLQPPPETRGRKSTASPAAD